MKKPTLGRIVLFYDTVSASPAIITNVFSDECVNLTVFNDGDTPTSRHTSVSLGTSPGQWGWPVVESLPNADGDLVVMDGGENPGGPTPPIPPKQ